MPTLVITGDVSDASETILFDDESTKRNGEAIPSKLSCDDDDDCSTILSRNLLGDDSIIDPMMDENDTSITYERIRSSATGLSYPNQSLYKEKYQDFVRTTIGRYKASHPNKLRDYRQMSMEEKEDAQRNLLFLLERLGIAKKNDDDDDDSSPPKNTSTVSRNSQVLMMMSEQRDDNDDQKTSYKVESSQHYQSYDPDETTFSISPIHPPRQQNSHTTTTNKDSSPNSTGSTDRSRTICHDESYIQADKSALLLSPGDFQPQQEEESSFGYNSNNDNDDGGGNDDDDDDDNQSNQRNEEADMSVEIVRGGNYQSLSSSFSNSYESPEHARYTSNKRLASTSGKRGADLARQKFNEEFSPSPQPSVDSEDLISSHMADLSISPGSEPRDLFEASQSPIVPNFTYESSDDDDDDDDDDDYNKGGRGEKYSDQYNMQPSHYSGRESSNNIMTVETVESFRCTKLNHRGGDKRRGMRDIPVNIRMAPGETFHLEKLPIKRNEISRSKNDKKKRTKDRFRRLVNFPDPLLKYNKSKKQTLMDIFEWIDESEDEHNATAGNIVFSLSYQQIIDLTLKILLKSESEKSFEDISKKSSLQGQTIIIGRSKEDISKWESALRESTGCSVLNHATLSLSERIRAATGEKATKYDVVLTTFDALKSPDMAIAVNESGYVVESQATKNDGWYSSRSSDKDKAQKCKQLSVLHQVIFKRIIFVDILGKKSFLVKHGTARAEAAIALRGDSRIAFFSKGEDDGISTFLTLRKSNRMALPSLLKLLRLDHDVDDEDDLEDILNDHMIDPKELYSST